jgi:lipid A 3-O-deacylase
MIPFVRLSLSFAALVFASSAATAGGPVIEKSVSEPWNPFAKGTKEFQIGAGAFASFEMVEPDLPQFVDVGGVVRLGWMLNDVAGDGLFRGNWEFLLEAYGGGITEGAGNLFIGAAVLFRYNFVQDGARWVPYFQLGGGGIYSDAHEDLTQRSIGSEFSFNLQGGFGVRYRCTERCAVFVEALYRHISNADLADRNHGVNSLGGFIGMSYFF